jgi:hypothetical protein
MTLPGALDWLFLMFLLRFYGCFSLIGLSGLISNDVMDVSLHDLRMHASLIIWRLRVWYCVNLFLCLFWVVFDWIHHVSFSDFYYIL